jgi:hypothetical protein
MATRYWTNGAGTGVVSTASNWTPSGAPSAGDILIFASSTTGASTTDNVVGGNYSALGLMAEIRIGQNFVKSFGSSSSYVRIEGTTVVLESGGDVYLDVESSTSTAKVIVNHTPLSADAVHLRGDIHELRVLDSAGDVSIEATTSSSTSSGNTEVDTIYVFNNMGGKVTTETSVTSLDTVHMDNGTMESSCAATTVSVYGGTFTQQSTGALTTLNVYGQDTFVYSSGSGTVTNLNVYDGRTVFQNNGSDGLTVTNCTLYGGIIDLQPSLRNITFTNNIVARAGTLLPPLASTISVAY